MQKKHWTSYLVQIGIALAGTWVAHLLPVFATPNTPQVNEFTTKTNAMFSGTVLAARGDSILSWNSFYPANTIDKCRIKSTSLYPIGSITKSFTATVAYFLCAEGQLNLDDKICKYVPEVSAACANEITIRHLLTHTTGLDVQMLYRSARKKSSAWPPDFAALFSDVKQLYPPGSVFHYCSGAYNLLAVIEERVTNLSLASLYSKYIFIPAGMKESGLITHNSPVKCFPSVVRTNGEESPSLTVDYALPYAGGSAYSNAIDIAKYLHFLNGRSSGKSIPLLNLSSLCQIPGAPCTDAGYGLGLIHSTIQKDETRDIRRIVYVSGRIGGYCSLVALIPDDSIEIVVSSNTFAESETVNQALREALAELGYSHYPSLQFKYEVVIETRAYLYKLLRRFW